MTLNRGGEHWRIQLQLPSGPEEVDEAFAALDRISLDIGSTVIVDVDSNVQGLYDCLIDLDIMEPENFQKLQKLAGYTEGLSSTKEKLFSGVLYAESPQTIDDILALASHLDEYAMLPHVTCDQALGQYLAESGIVSFPEKHFPHLDYGHIGEEHRLKHGGVYTEDGYVTHRGSLVALEEKPKEPVFCVRLEAYHNHPSHPESFSMTLPASFEELNQAKYMLRVNSFEEVKVAEAECWYPHLAKYLPLQSHELRIELLDELAEHVQQMGRESDTLRKYLSVLEAEQPENIQAALECAVKLEDYVCVPNDCTEYGEYVLKRSGGNEALISMLDGFTDFAKLGRHFMQKDGVRQTDFGGIRRLGTPFPKQENSPEPSTLKLYMPLTGEFFEPDRWGNWQEEGNPLDGCGLLRYQDHILAALVRNRMPEESERGVMYWYGEEDSINRKVLSAAFTVECRERQLWGIAECRVLGELTPQELEKLKEYISGQASDGWGEGFEQREIRVDGGELYVHLWNPDNWSIQTEQECFAPNMHRGGIDLG